MPTTTDTFNEHLMLNKRIDLLKSQNKTSSIPSSPVLKRQDSKPLVATPMAASSSVLPIDNTKVTIGKLRKRNLMIFICKFSKKLLAQKQFRHFFDRMQLSNRLILLGVLVNISFHFLQLLHRLVTNNQHARVFSKNDIK